jgi:DivIVA domain-containing protein
VETRATARRTSFITCGDAFPKRKLKTPKSLAPASRRASVTPDVDVCLLGDAAPSHGVEQVPKVAEGEVREENDGTLGHSPHLDFERVRSRRRGGILEGVAHEPSGANETQKPAPTGAESAQEHGFADLQFYVPQDLLDVRFPAAVRGYDRGAVETYVKRVNRVIAELKVRSSPPAAVRHAIEGAEETVQGLLKAAREAAHQITQSAQHEAEENTARAKAEAATLIVDTSADADRMKAEAEQVMANAKREAEATVATAESTAAELRASAKADAENIVARAQAEADACMRRLEREVKARREDAEAEMRELQAETDVVSNERHELLEDIRQMSGDLVNLANAAATRIKGEKSEKEAESEPQDVPQPTNS